MDEMDQMGRPSKMEGGSGVFSCLIVMCVCWCVCTWLLSFQGLLCLLDCVLIRPLRFQPQLQGPSTRSLAFLSSVERLIPGSETDVLSRTKKRKQNHPSIAQCAYGILASLLLPRNPAPIRQSLIPPAKDGISYVTGLRTGGSLDLVRTEIVATWFQVELL